MLASRRSSRLAVAGGGRTHPFRYPRIRRYRITYMEVAMVAMMCGRMDLGQVVREVDIAGEPVEMELVLSNAVANPVESHVHSLGPLGR